MELQAIEGGETEIRVYIAYENNLFSIKWKKEYI